MTPGQGRALVRARTYGWRCRRCGAGLLTATACALAVALASMWAALPVARASVPDAISLTVLGNKLVTGDGTTVRLSGVNYSGTEYACVQGWGIFDGPNDAAAVAGLVSWNVRSVRIPLNEDCWLGINGVDERYSGSNYRKAIVDFVNLLHARGIYAELSLVWGAPGGYLATYQSGGPDEDHSPAMWASLASTFSADRAVVLAPWGETVTDWACFAHGCDTQATYGPSNTPYRTAGMQQAVDVMRGAGYRGVIAIPCVDFANDCADAKGSWLSYRPTDPLGQLIAEAHVYGNNICGAQRGGECLEDTLAPLAASVPLLLGEVGETYDDSECSSDNIDVILRWADAHGVSYQAWAWDTWGTCLSLISRFDGTPNTTTPTGAAYASYVRSRLLESAPLAAEDLGCCLAKGSQPGASSWAPARLDIVVRGTDDTVYHRFYSGAWSGFEALGGVTFDSPASASWGPGRLDVFVRGADGQLWHKWYGGAWSHWEPLGGLLTSGPAVASWGPGRLDVFARGSDGQLWHKWYAGSWSAWESLGGRLTSAPAVTAWGPGRLDVALTGAGGVVYHKFFQTGWSGYEPLGANLVGGPSIAAPSPGHLVLLGDDLASHALVENSFDGNGRWSGWFPRAESPAGDPVVASWGVGRIDVFWAGDAGRLVHAWSG